jgi:hypothetical protein
MKITILDIFYSLSLSPPLFFFSLSLSLTSEEGVPKHKARPHTLITGQREKEGEREHARTLASKKHASKRSSRFFIQSVSQQHA